MFSTSSFVIRDTQDTSTSDRVIPNFKLDPPFPYETLNSDDDTALDYREKTPTSYQQNVFSTGKLHSKMVRKITPKWLLKFNKF